MLQRTRCLDDFIEQHKRTVADSVVTASYIYGYPSKVLNEVAP